MNEPRTAHTYNQNHTRRPYAAGRRRVSIYVAWSYPAEAGRNPAELDNRFSTMTEVRRVAWPAHEEPRWSDPGQFQQGIAGSLEFFFLNWLPFQAFVEEITGFVVPVYQRVDHFNFHPHLPHYAVTTDQPDVVHVLARQPIDLARPHPFTDAGDTEFNAFLWMPPAGERAGDVLLADSTVFSSLFGGDESLRNFWRNVA